MDYLYLLEFKGDFDVRLHDEDIHEHRDAMPRLILGYERPRAVDDVNLEKTSRSE
jgi:hypothetical protein